MPPPPESIRSIAPETWNRSTGRRTRKNEKQNPYENQITYQSVKQHFRILPSPGPKTPVYNRDARCGRENGKEFFKIRQSPRQSLLSLCTLKLSPPDPRRNQRIVFPFSRA